MADTGILEGAGASGEVKPIQGFAVSKCAETCLEKSPSEHFSWQNSEGSDVKLISLHLENFVNKVIKYNEGSDSGMSSNIKSLKALIGSG
ncbi:hypothetical protein ScPMuIL_006784 [Solemya velum]